MLAIKCGKIVPVTIPAIENGILLIDDGKIKDVCDAGTCISFQT